MLKWGLLRGRLCGAMSAEAEMFELEHDLLENVIALHIAGRGRCAGSGHCARKCEARLHTLETGLALPP